MGPVSAKPADSAPARRGGRWGVVIALASAQFIMVLDSTVMNVSIQRVVTDLDTTVTLMQLAIATYTLTMASLMLLGGRLGDIIGRRRAFRIGLALFGLGALITAVAPSMAILIGGWSIVEALGAALMVPAVAALIAGNYEGPDRAICYGILGGIAGAAAAAGPIIGGWVSTEFSWRYVFAAEAVIVVGLLAASRLIADTPRPERRPRLDVGGAALSVAAVSLTVVGIVQSTAWGWIEPKGALEIAGTKITPFGFSVVPFIVLAGLALMFSFLAYERRVEARGGDPLIRAEMLRIGQLRSGLSTSLVMMLALGGVFFILPLYLQIVLGQDPLDTGLHVAPLSIAVFLVSLGASRLSSRIAPRRIVRFGMLAILAGSLLLLATIEPTLEALPFSLAMAVVGVGLGAMASQLGNVNLSAVEASETSQVGGLQGTAQNLGTALGTALIGSVLLTGLTAGFERELTRNPDLPAKVRSEADREAGGGLQFVPAPRVGPIARDQGVDEAEAKALVADYEDAQLSGLKTALGAVAAIVLLGLALTRGLPARPLGAPRAGPAP